MHDVNGTELKKGDVVLLPCRIEELHPGDDFCNVTLRSLHSRRPDGAIESISAINTGVLVLFELPPEQHAKDALFLAVVNALRPKESTP